MTKLILTIALLTASLSSFASLSCKIVTGDSVGGERVVQELNTDEDGLYTYKNGSLLAKINYKFDRIIQFEILDRSTFNISAIEVTEINENSGGGLLAQNLKNGGEYISLNCKLN